MTLKSRRFDRKNKIENSDQKFDNKSYSESNKLLALEDAPRWTQNYKNILNGYRPSNNSYIKCYNSLFYIHNETGNIYTHLIGSIIFGLLILNSINMFINSKIGLFDFLSIFLYLSSAFLCLLISSHYHLFLCHSYEVSNKWSKCDYVGIIFLIVSSFITIVHNTFYCDTFWNRIYTLSILLIATLACFIACLERFNDKKYKLLRVATFFSLAFLAVFPFSHGIYNNGFNFAYNILSFKWYWSMVLIYNFGALFYAFEFPESKFPGKFDYYFHSHQIFHVFVVLAALTHYAGIILAFNNRQEGNIQCFIEV